MRVLGIVPARAGSKRVPGKNLRPLGGKPLVVRAIETALAAKKLAAVAVSTDSDEALALAAAYPVVALKRPDALASDLSPAIDYVRHALDAMAQRGEAPFDAVAIIQPSSPLTLASDIDGTIAVLEAAPSADSAVSVVKVDHAVHPVKLKRLDADRLLPYVEEEKGRMAAHELPDVYVRNCSVYVARIGTVQKGTLIGDDSRAFVMPRERSVDINDELDFKFAQFLFGQSNGG